ncbi:hypothetical protein L1987_20037 [Smallanthus sonchifolius]|uniref:Uncharacterized protein n=2 Tax=Smallanthus sonchifolius TaxID=185202 RepID=A0ACB9ISS9_9ASTR|nr:hypothetical protein L1987_20034 [Smallanthus sonchifolius]KAI3810425.1 hypothetical protein L1987_20037 [Smallanthus sonchifolius]
MKESRRTNDEPLEEEISTEYDIPLDNILAFELLLGDAYDQFKEEGNMTRLLDEGNEVNANATGKGKEVSTEITNDFNSTKRDWKEQLKMRNTFDASTSSILIIVPQSYFHLKVLTFSKRFAENKKERK